MPILFSLVACEKSILAKFASCDGNFMEIAEQVISKISSRNDKMTYSHGRYLFHYIAEDKLLFLCITDKICQRSRSFLFLNEIRRKFMSSRKNFIDVLATEMYRYSEDYSTITIRKGELDELNSIGVDSSENILGEKILHVQNSDKLSYCTVSNVRKSPERVVIAVENSRFFIICIGVLVLVVAFILYSFGPMSCAVVLGVIIMSCGQSLVNVKRKPE